MSDVILHTARIGVASIAKAGLMAGAAVLAAGPARSEVLTFALNEDLTLGETFAMPGGLGITFQYFFNPANPTPKLSISSEPPTGLATNNVRLFGPGTVIGPGTEFFGGPNSAGGVLITTQMVVPGSFLGFSLQTGPEATRYGWIEVSIFQVPGQVLIKGFGYETIPGRALTTPVPEPDSLVLLAAGSLVVAAAAARRRRRPAPALSS